MNLNFAADTTFEEHIQEVVVYMSRGKPESERSGYIEEKQSSLVNLDDDKKRTIVDGLMEELKGLNYGTANEIEGLFNLYGYLCIQLFKDGLDTEYTKLVEICTSNKAIESSVKSRVVNSLLNNLDDLDSFKADLYKSLLRDNQIALKEHDEFVSWLSKLDGQSRRSLLIQVINQLNQTADKKQLIAYQKLLLEIDDSDSETAKSLILNSIEQPDNYSFDDVLSINGVLKVKQSNEFNLLQSFINLDYNLYSSSIKQLSSVKEPLLAKKFSLLQLNDYCSNFIGKSIHYADLANVINAKDDKVLESTIIELIKSGLTMGRLNQSTKQFKVNESVKFKLNQKDWLELQSQLVKFKSNLSNISSFVN